MSKIKYFIAGGLLSAGIAISSCIAPRDAPGAQKNEYRMSPEVAQINLPFVNSNSFSLGECFLVGGGGSAFALRKLLRRREKWGLGIIWLVG